MDFPERVGPVQSIPAPFPQTPQVRLGEAEIDQPAPVATNHSSSEVISLDAMRNAMVANFEQADLDVPAFLRKRNELM